MTPFALTARILNAGLMMGIPLLLIMVLIRRGKEWLRPIGIGAAGFILSQAGHIPFNSFLLVPGLEKMGIDLTAQEGLGLFILGIALGLSAGVFEEITRFLIFRFWLAKNPRTLLPVSYGAGHGGIEAFGLGILALVVLIQIIALGGEGMLESFPADQAALIQTQITTYWEVPVSYSLLGAWERISALAFHLGASILVYRSVREKKYHWLIIAILGHVVLDAFAVVASKKMDFVLLESILFLFAAGWLVFCWTMRRVEIQAEEASSPLPREPRLIDSDVTKEQLEESRYDT